MSGAVQRGWRRLALPRGKDAFCLVRWRIVGMVRMLALGRLRSVIGFDDKVPDRDVAHHAGEWPTASSQPRLPGSTARAGYAGHPHGSRRRVDLHFDGSRHRVGPTSAGATGLATAAVDRCVTDANDARRIQPTHFPQPQLAWRLGFSGPCGAT